MYIHRTRYASPLDNTFPSPQELLCGYLEDSPCLMAQELLVMFYLTHHRYAEAVALQEKIRPLAKVTPILACHNFLPPLLVCYFMSKMSNTPSRSTLHTSADKCLNKLVNIPLNEFEEVCEYTHVHTPYYVCLSTG